MPQPVSTGDSFYGRALLGRPMAAPCLPREPISHLSLLSFRERNALSATLFTGWAQREPRFASEAYSAFRENLG